MPPVPFAELLRGPGRADTQIVGWSFVRGTERVECEARPGCEAGPYQLVLTLPGGVKQVEQYPDQAALLRRQFELIRAWKAQGWREVEAGAEAEAELLSGARGR